MPSPGHPIDGRFAPSPGLECVQSASAQTYRRSIRSMPTQCPRCHRTVYAAEGRMNNGFKYHAGCYKCTMCNKLLDSTTVAEHGAELYCKFCHGRKYGPKGVGFGQGAGTLSTDTGERFGNYNNTMGNRPMTAEAYTAPINPSVR